jgi:short-subunit dehydrogenase
MAKGLAVVTGASSGIGLELAKILAQEGYDLIVASAGERLESAANHLAAGGSNVTSVTADLATREGVDKLWSVCEQAGTPIDIACINAGVGVGGKFVETDLEEELNLVQLNCGHTVHFAKHVVRQMVPRGAGRILFTASIAGEMVAPREAVYAASKAFVLSFAHSLRYELKDTGVSVTALQPGPTDTDFFHRAGMDDTQAGSEGKKESNPADVAREGYDALMAGKDHVYAASFKTKLEGALANFVPGEVKGKMHDDMARPLAEK